MGELQYKGRLSEVARAKYGTRVDTSQKARIDTYRKLKSVLALGGRNKIVTDAKPQYQSEIQGELRDIAIEHVAVSNGTNQSLHAVRPTRRKNRNDRMFWFNHVAARIRHDLSRMMRKVWVTTKKREWLQMHLDLFTCYFNQYKFRF